MRSDRVIELIMEHREIFQRHEIARLLIVGSCAAGEEGADVDLVVECQANRNATLLGLLTELRIVFGSQLDIIDWHRHQFWQQQVGGNAPEIEVLL